MERNELRIGNLFYPIGRNTEIHMPIEIPYSIFSIGVFKVVAIKFPGVWLQSIPKEFDINDLSPIPLTPEILEACGFVKSDNKKTSDFEKEIVQGMIIISDNSNEDEIEYTVSLAHKELLMDDRDFINIDVPMKFLHQLQNLYFALTGEELEIKELQHA